MELPARSVVVLVYDGVAADEAGAVVEICGAAGLDVVIAAVASVNITSYHGRVEPERRTSELAPCGALVVPGGMGVQRAARNQPLLSAIAALASEATWLGATSTGSVLLAAAGVVDGARATTHWLARDLITDQGLEMVDASFVEHGRLLTAAGLVSAADLSFRLVGALAGTRAEEEVRHAYQPRPPSDARYQRRRRHFWQNLVRRRRTEPVAEQLDPGGLADVVVLDLPVEH